MAAENGMSEEARELIEASMAYRLPGNDGVEKCRVRWEAACIAYEASLNQEPVRLTAEEATSVWYDARGIDTGDRAHFSHMIPVLTACRERDAAWLRHQIKTKLTGSRFYVDGTPETKEAVITTIGMVERLLDSSAPPNAGDHP